MKRKSILILLIGIFLGITDGFAAPLVKWSKPKSCMDPKETCSCEERLAKVVLPDAPLDKDSQDEICAEMKEHPDKVNTIILHVGERTLLQVLKGVSTGHLNQRRLGKRFSQVSSSLVGDFNRIRDYLRGLEDMENVRNTEAFESLREALRNGTGSKVDSESADHLQQAGFDSNEILDGVRKGRPQPDTASGNRLASGYSKASEGGATAEEVVHERTTVSDHRDSNGNGTIDVETQKCTNTVCTNTKETTLFRDYKPIGTATQTNIQVCDLDGGCGPFKSVIVDDLKHCVEDDCNGDGKALPRICAGSLGLLPGCLDPSISTASFCGATGRDDSECLMRDDQISRLTADDIVNMNIDRCDERNHDCLRHNTVIDYNLAHALKNFGIGCDRLNCNIRFNGVGYQNGDLNPFLNSDNVMEAVRVFSAQGRFEK